MRKNKLSDKQCKYFPCDAYINERNKETLNKQLKELKNNFTRFTMKTDELCTELMKIENETTNPVHKEILHESIDRLKNYDLYLNNQINEYQRKIVDLEHSFSTERLRCRIIQEGGSFECKCK